MEIEREFNMEYGAFTSNSTTYGNFSENNMISNTELGFMDELLIEGCWLETTGLGLNLFPPGPLPASAQAFNHEYRPSHHYLPPLEINSISHLSINQYYSQQIYQESTEGTFPESEGILVEGTELGMIRRWWIGPSWANPGPCSSVKERLMMAVGYLTECTKNMNVLIQIWVPISWRSSGGRYNFLTTQDQPYSFGANCKSLANYRDVSRAYDHEFAVEEDIDQVFWEQLPEYWTPDIVRFFKRDEYPHDIINYAHDEQYSRGVRGFLALPVFERGSGTCLGVVEIVTTADQNINVHRPELENVICQALDQANVDLRSYQSFSPPSVKAYNYDELYQVALAEIVEVLATVCKTHRLPLALTWAPCLQQGKGGCRHSDENYAHCLSTVDTACFVSDAEVLGFHEACSEYHLFRGQGTVGTAFTTTKPCFATDMSAFSKIEYPLSHHARMFGLRAAVAIPFRSLYTGSADFVLEFFLPKDCHDTEEQNQMLNSLSIVLQQACRSLHAVIEKVVLDEDEVIYSVEEVVIASDDVRIKKEEPQKSVSSPLKEACSKESSWIAHMKEVQQKGKGVSISLEYQEEDPKEEFKVTTHWDNTQGASLNGQGLSEFGQLQQSSGSKGSVDGGGGSYSYGGRRSSSGRKTGEKRRTKTQKTISLSVLRQYFAGSLKDAAKSIGVCPTTLKRICRQHGITRWPSRKIKKVGHSLRKLQSVIDSVPGAEGAIQIGSFYTNFPEFNSPGNGSFSSMKMISDGSKQSNPIPESSLLNHGSGTHSKSLPSSCSQTFGPSSFCASTAAQQHSTPINALSNADTLMREKPGGLLPMACSDADLHTLNRHEQNLLPAAECLKSFGGLPDLETLPILLESSSHNSGDGDLQLEIARRLNLDYISRVDLRYLDDDREYWVLLACDADLQECIHIFRASQSHTLRLSLQHASNPYLGSPFGSSDLS
ncbi:hypothetical protein F2P56_036248 [Juglans regia]|uniref:Protein NLP2-like n=1 Tax=Juglans regia TaxID=51240 RepID=A0A833TQV7_JUGRE|nr:hypothetical protein F2P56_036248 [Juglans regia]